MRIALAAALLLTLGVFGNPAYAAKEPAAGDAPRARRAEHSDTPDLLRLEDEWAKADPKAFRVVHENPEVRIYDVDVR